MNQCYEAAKGDYILFAQDDWRLDVSYDFIDFAIDILNERDDVYTVVMANRGPRAPQGPLIRTEGHLSAYIVQPYEFRSSTNQIQLFSKANWLKYGPLPTMGTINWKRWPVDAREGSVVEWTFGKMLQAAKMHDARIEKGQFIHTLKEGIREPQALYKRR